MKLVIQIPCFNEEDNVLEVLKNLPKKINGINKIAVLVIDDASTDSTSRIAAAFGAEVIKMPSRTGLSNVFRAGVEYALKTQADILVNIDGDNQYFVSDIEKIIQPIIEGDADIVVGTRPINNIRTFSPLKKFLQKIGSKVVKLISGVDIKDAASGFRAFSCNALLRLNIFNDFTYTIESLIQAGAKKLIVKNIDIRVNPQFNRKSKLFKSNFDYIYKQMKNILRFFIIYKPFKFFSIISFSMLVLGLGLGFRFLYYYLTGFGSGHIQSLILCAIVMTLSFICFMIAILGDLFSINRRILEDIQYEIRLKKYKK